MFPATGHPRLPPATRNDTYTQRETGERNGCCGHHSFQVTGAGHGGRPLGSQPFSPQPTEAWCQLLMAERQIPELPMPVAVTRHPSLCLSLYSILHTQYSLVFYSTEPLSLRASSYAPCPRVTMPTCPLAQALVPMSPCPRVTSPFLAFAPEPFSASLRGCVVFTIRAMSSRYRKNIPSRWTSSGGRRR